VDHRQRGIQSRRWIGLSATLLCLAGCGGGSSSGSHGVSSGFLYAAAAGGPNTFTASIYGFAVFPDGSLESVPGLPAPAENGGGPIAITRDSKLLYSPDGYLNVNAFQINADGSLTAASQAATAMTDTVVGLLAHPSADYIYVSGSSGLLIVCAVDSATGALSPTSSVNLSVNSAWFLVNSPVITPDGRYLYQNDLNRNDDSFPAVTQLAGFSTDPATGALSPIPGTPLTLVTPSPSTTSWSGPMVIDPTGRFLFVGYQFVEQNIGTNGGLFAFSIDPATGALTAVPGSPFGLDGFAGSVGIDASGKYLMVGVYQLGGGVQLDEFSIDAATGAPTLMPSSFGAGSLWGPFAVDPSGSFIYAGETAPPYNGPASVAALTIDPSSGALASSGATSIKYTVGVSFIALTH